ncbi:MAG: DUF4158 domain-containing protein [Pseudomonadota bacterium]
MTQLSILTTAEQKAFDEPPVLTREEQRIYFAITPDVRPTIACITSPVNKAGFILQLGCFRANGRFYVPKMFRHRDVNVVSRLLKLESLKVDEYSETVRLRHRQKIKELLGWQDINPQTRGELIAFCTRYTNDQEYPRNILKQLVDLCWKRQWVIPSYHDFSATIADCFNSAELEVVQSLEKVLNSQQVDHLESLLEPAEDGSLNGSLMQLKRIDQSLKPTDIKRSMKILATFQSHYVALAQAVTALQLSDKATEYYATWLERADHQQLSQLSSRFKTYLHVLAFIKHQFYQRQDHAIDVLLKSVSSAINQSEESR